MTAIATATDLFARLDAEGARYVHWKSNEHLAAALAGETDLDVLFDRRQYGLVRRVLDECGYRPFRTTDLSGYPGIEDHFALDPGTGRLVHCHAHFILSAGRKYLKGHRIPWEERFLTSAVRDPSSGVWIADPNLELLALLIRAAMKLRARDRLGVLLGRKAFRGGMVDEYEWLLERIEPGETVDLATSLLGPDGGRVVEDLLESPPTDRELRRLRRASKSTIEEWETRRGISATWEGWRRELHAIRTALNRRTLRRTVPGRRVMPGGGIVVAFIGSDGSGKSTVVEAITSQLARKLDVLRVYMGSGVGPVSLLRLPLRPLARAVDRLRGPDHGDPAAPSPTDRDPGEADSRDRDPTRRDPAPILVGRVLWALTLAREKRLRLQTTWRAKNRGLIVITDRFPQAQVAGFNDGPLLRKRAESGGTLLRKAAAIEAKTYELAARQPPDLVVRLRITPEIAVARKPEMSESEVARRDAAIASMTWPDGTRVIDVDASQPLDAVLRQVLLAIWREV